MRGAIIYAECYAYVGDIESGELHGIGKVVYNSCDSYEGEFYYGKLDGFGTYTWADGDKHIGYFAHSKFNGAGTLYTKNYITKGIWRFDVKHGIFYKTFKKTFKTVKQLWIKDRLVKSEDIQYIPPDALATYKNESQDNRIKQTHTDVKEPANFDEKKCITCLDKNANSTNNLCGHVCMCYECLSRVEECPICRCPIGIALKLYIS
jgi:hypothetical protein